MTLYASSDLVSFGMKAEAVEGTQEGTGAYQLELTNGIGVDPTSNILADATVSGAGEPVDARTNLRGGALTTPATMRYNDNRILVAAALRAAFPSEVTIIGSSDINHILGATHRDGTTGAQITGPSAAFDDLINYDGATGATHPDGGAQHLMMQTSGAADGDNNLPRRIKAVYDDGIAKIDVADGYTGGSAGLFGAPIIAQTLESVTIRVGSAIRNRLVGGSSYSAKWQFADLTTNAVWQSVRGAVANDLAVSWSGKDGATIEVPWICYEVLELTGTDPSSGPGGFDDLVNGYWPMLIGADDLTFFAIVTATTPLVLSSLLLTGFNYTAAGNCAAIDDVSGTSTVTGVRRGAHTFSGSIDVYNVDSTIAEALSQLGSSGNAEKAGIDIAFSDSTPHRIWLGCLNNEFAPFAPNPGAGGNTVGGSLAFTGQRASLLGRSFVWQEFSTI